jgi:hypothetical protein
LTGIVCFDIKGLLVMEYFCMEENKHKILTPPYLSFNTFLDFIEGLSKDGVPHKIDRNGQALSSFSGTAQAQLLTTLKYFHLISARDGIPTEDLRNLVVTSAEGKKTMLRAMIISSYPFLFNDGFDLKSATSKDLQLCFEKAGAFGGTIRKCVAFFLAAAKHTGIELSQNIKRFKFTAIEQERETSRVIKTEEKGNVLYHQETLNPSQTPSLSSEQVWLNKFPNFDPSWPDDVKKSWFESFRELRKEFNKLQ